MSLAIFDLDNTLLDGDSDYLWGRFLVGLGVVDEKWYESENQRFYDEYKLGTLDIMEFLDFSLKPLGQHSPDKLADWHARFMQEIIQPIMLPKAKKLIAQHRDAGDVLLIITATNRFVTAPIADAFGVDNLIATEAEQINDHYTGKIEGIPCFQEGKVKRLQQWLDQTGGNLTGSYFYSDSYNDLPLLEIVSHPVTVDADERLIQYSQTRAWDCISLRN